MSRGVNKGRQAKGNMLPDRSGENSNFAKLTCSDVLVIRKKLADGFSTKDIAQEFNVSVDNIRRINRRDTWRKI